MAADTLALFDLDHTLIPFDSGMAWTHFLVGRGVLPAQAEEQYLDFCHQYVAGTLAIQALHRASLQPLLRYPRATLAVWQREFSTEMASRLPSSALDLVRRHQKAGHLCAIVTATPQLVAEPFARLFGVDHLVATRSASVGASPDVALPGEVDDEPCYRQHKLARVQQWLALQPAGSRSSLEEFAQSWFYSDSISDLPLLSAVSHPVVVHPDERLRALALDVGWPELDLN